MLSFACTLLVIFVWDAEPCRMYTFRDEQTHHCVLQSLAVVTNARRVALSLEPDFAASEHALGRGGFGRFS